MTDDDRYGSLFREAIGLLPGGQPDPVRARTAAVTRRRHRVHAAAAATVAAGLAVLLVAALSWSGQTIGVPAAPAGDPTASRTCPALIPGTSNATVDYADAFRWDSHLYVVSDTLNSDPTYRALGPQVTTITCSIRELTADNGNQVQDGPWPDGTATFLPTGTPVLTVQGVEPRCELAVRTTDRDHDTAALKIFIAVQEPGWEPLC